MALKPPKVPRWNDTLGNNTEPAEVKKDLGWTANEKPISSSFFNWLLNLTGLWFKWIDERATDVGGVAPRIGLRGIGSTGEAGGTGGTFTGGGAAAGAAGVGGTTSGPGVTGTGGAPNGVGVLGIGTGTGTAVEGNATGSTGYGVAALGDATAPARASLRVGPQNAAPTVPAAGDIYYDSVLNKLRFYDSSAWRSVGAHVITIGNGTTTFGDFNGADQAPFIAAIAALPSGGAIFVQRGIYTFTATLTIATNNIALIGENNDVAVITGSLNGAPIVRLTGNEIELRDLKIQQTHGPSANSAVEIAGNRCEVDTCTLEHTYAGGIADNAPYSVVHVLNGQKNRIVDNVIVFIPSVLVAGNVDRFGIKLEANSSSAANALCGFNIVARNQLDLTPNGATAPTTHTAFIGFIAFNSSTGAALCNRNTIAHNVLSGLVGNATKVSYYGVYARTSRTGTGNINVVGNIVQGHVFTETNTAIEGALVVGHAVCFSNGLGGSISDNSFANNIMATATGTFAYTGALPPGTTDNSLEFVKFFMGATLGAPTTNQALTDEHANKVV